ncbi:MAG: amidohydrolase family protein [Acidimicrobiales bacterium]|jgi:predicted TIM-barrel fold metal-dependent hydrolase
MDETSIYSCDDHLDLRSVPPGLWSELFRRQVVATFEEETLAQHSIPHLGADSCMWAADFPHTDSMFPESQRSIAETLGMLPDEDRRKITALNCARLYGFEYVARGGGTDAGGRRPAAVSSSS